MPQKKRVFTLDLHGKYPAAIKNLTFPTLQHYARRIGASFEVITEDKFPGWPDRTNKFQVHELIRGEDDTWAIFFDADTLIHPDCIDFTELIGPDTVLHNASDFAAIRWKPDAYLLRDGRNIGSCSWFQLAHSWCRDFWTPPTMQQHPFEDRYFTLEEIVSSIRPTQNEAINRLQADHLIDDRTFSANIARFGLKFSTVQKVMQRNMVQQACFYHQYLLSVPEKIEKIKEIGHYWQLDGPVPPCANMQCPRCHPQGMPR